MKPQPTIEIEIIVPDNVLIQDARLPEDIKDELIKRGVKIKFEKRKEIPGAMNGLELLYQFAFTPEYEALKSIVETLSFLVTAGQLSHSAYQMVKSLIDQPPTEDKKVSLVLKSQDDQDESQE